MHKKLHVSNNHNIIALWDNVVIDHSDPTLECKAGNDGWKSDIHSTVILKDLPRNVLLK